MTNLWGNNCIICRAPTFSQIVTVCHRHGKALPMPETITHIAGLWGEHGDRVRQRCSWCGAMLVSYRLSMVEEWDRPKMWSIGTRVTMSNGAGWTTAATDSDPDDACFKPVETDTSDFDRYCAEHKVLLGEESDAFDEWMKEVIGLATRYRRYSDG